MWYIFDMSPLPIRGPVGVDKRMPKISDSAYLPRPQEMSHYRTLTRTRTMNLILPMVPQPPEGYTPKHESLRYEARARLVDENGDLYIVDQNHRVMDIVPFKQTYKQFCATHRSFGVKHLEWWTAFNQPDECLVDFVQVLDIRLMRLRDLRRRDIRAFGISYSHLVKELAPREQKREGALDRCAQEALRETWDKVWGKVVPVKIMGHIVGWNSYPYGEIEGEQWFRKREKYGRFKRHADGWYYRQRPITVYPNPYVFVYTVWKYRWPESRGVLEHQEWWNRYMLNKLKKNPNFTIDYPIRQQYHEDCDDQVGRHGARWRRRSKK